MLIPGVRLYFACAHGEVDETNDAVTLVNPLFELVLPKDAAFPFVVGSIFVYVNLTGGLGSFRIHVEVSDEEGRRVTKTKPFPVAHTAGNRKAGNDYLFKLPEFKIEKPGAYTVGLYHNYKCIAATDVCITSFGG